MGSAPGSGRHCLSTSPEGHLVVVSGPSGAGKSTILDAVLERTDARFSVSATTRAPRHHESDGSEYHFLDRPEFEALIESGDVLEWAEYGGHLYGTLRREVQPILDAGADVVLDIENEGAKQIKSSYPSAVLIFIRPPSIEELRRRLLARGDTDLDDIERRLAVAEQQITEAPSVYDHIVLNDDVDTAIGHILDILASLGDPSADVPAPSTTRGDPP